MEDKNLEGWDIEITNICPKCGSKKITEINTHQVVVYKNLKSGKIIGRDTSLTPYSRVFYSYICRKCGWRSITFYE